MRAAVFHAGPKSPGHWLHIEDVPAPRPAAGEILLKVIACGVCRTDLHIVEGDLPAVRPRIIPGHQIVGEVVEGATSQLPLGERVGVSWIGGVDGACWFCAHQMENLCDHPVFTGYSIDGGYAEFAAVRADFAYPVPLGLDAIHVAPLLCAGIIGFRSLRVAGVQRGERVGLFGYGSSATLALQVLLAWDCATRPDSRPRAMPARHGSAMSTPALPYPSTGPSHLRPWAVSSSARSPRCARAEWSPSTPSISTRCRPSITTSSSGANGRCAASPT